MGYLLFGFFGLFLVLGVPVAISIAIAAMLSLLIGSEIPLVIIPTRMYAAVDSFPMMAIPYFILAGAIMETGGLSKRLANFALALVGPLRGGLGHVTVLASMFFSAISGSGPATTAAIGGIMIPTMVENKYDKNFAVALQATAGAMGPIIPPSIPFVTYGVVTGASIGALFLAGILPGVLIGLSLVVAVYFIAGKRGYVGSNQSYSLRKIITTFKEAFWVLLMPVIILGGIYGGVFTPTEAAVVACAYALLLGFGIYRELKLTDLPKIFISSALVAGMVMFIVACASTFSWTMTSYRIPDLIAKLVLSFTDNKIIILMLINILLLMTGCFMEGNSAIIILSPILMPIITALGINPIHFGALMVVNLCLGLVTPPVGVDLYVACGIAGGKIEEVIRSLIPLFLAALAALLLITYIPDISLLIPRLLGAIK